MANSFLRARLLPMLVAATGLGACALPDTPANPSAHTSTLAPIAATVSIQPANAATQAAWTAQLDQFTRSPISQAILLGEQHDVPEHQQLHHRAVVALNSQQQLAALAVEMAEQGQTTRALSPLANEASVRAALQWDVAAWPWAAYGPAVMAAVRAGVPVLGANLPQARWRETMQDTALDAQLPVAALQAQQQAIRTGHCNLLPESQIAPMTRIQIARDVAMAAVVRAAAQPGKTVLLLAGHGHVNRALGVPQHLPAGFTYRAVLLQAAPEAGTTDANTPFDVTLALGTAPQTDYCAEFSASQTRPPKTPKTP